MATHCLLCGTLNDGDFERCSLCKVEPERALRVVTESQSWVNATLVILVFLALASSVAFDLYLAHRVISQSSTENGNKIEDPSSASMLSNEKGAGPVVTSPNASPSMISGRQVAQMILDSLGIVVWLLSSLGFIAAVMYATKIGTMWVCKEVVRRRLRERLARNEYVFPGLKVVRTSHLDHTRSDVRGTL
jgi:hypothetical protein